MRMAVKVNADIDARDPTKRVRRGHHEGDSGPRAGDAGAGGMHIEPEGPSVRHQARDMKDHAMRVLGIGEDVAAALVPPHEKMSTATTARTRIDRLTQGPHKVVPAMIVIARNGKKDL